MKKYLLGFLALAFLLTLICEPSTLCAQGTAFTYQGRLNDGAAAANGSYDLSFALYDVASVGVQQGVTITNSACVVNNGLFTVILDFGNQFPGANRWLEIGVRTNGSSPFATLVPRQPLTAAPYAITAGNVTGPLPAAQLTGTVPAAQLAGTYSGAVTFNNAGNSITGDGTGLVNVNATTLGGFSSASFWQLTGNTGTTPGTHFLGTTDNQSLEIKVNGSRALRVEPANYGAPNLIGGASVNAVGSGVVGATIGGGGAVNYLGGINANPNRVDANFGTIGGGMAHTIETNARLAVIGGGQHNRIQENAYGAMLGGGYHNTIQSNAYLATLGGGLLNTIDTNSQYATLGGGYANTIQNDAPYATLGGGQFNTIQDHARNATLAGGQMNNIQPSATNATLVGGSNNTIQTNAYGATLGGGCYNTIQENNWLATIGGGGWNTLVFYGYYATICGGISNSAGFAASVGGGQENASLGSYCTISGGYSNWVENGFGTIGGGTKNFITDGATASTIGGGSENQANGGVSSTIGGGLRNLTTGSGTTVGGGQDNSAQGSWSTCPGGIGNQAIAPRSFAAGTRAKAMGNGAFVWADSQDADFAPSTANEVSFRCQNGVIFTDDSSWTHAVHWTPGNASWTFTSDRNTKDRIVPVNEGDVLERIARLPISEWSYIGFPQRHIGPMAQDFHALFPLNDDDKTLNEADLHGVALAAIRGLNEKVVAALKTKEAEIESLKQSVAELKQLVQSLADKQ